MPNLKRLTIVAVAIVLAGGTLHGVHYLQQGRRVETLVNDIEEARQAKNTRQHINALKRYLQARPDDSERRVELLDLQAEHAPSSEVLFNVYNQYQTLLKKDPDNEEYRERVISLALRAGEYEDVLSHLEILSQQRELTPEMLIWRATSQQKKGDEDEAFKTYLEAIELDPGQFEAYVQLETITRRGREADEKTGFWIRQMTEANPNSAKAHLTQARYFRDTGDLPAALSAAETALRLNDLPTESVLLWSDIVMMSREQEMETEGSTWQAGDEQLTERLRKAWEADPGEGEFAAKLSTLALRRNRTDEAERILRKGLEQAPDDPLLRWELADLAITQGKLDEARELATQLTVSGLQRGLIEYLRGRIFLREQEWHEAAKCLRRARGDLTPTPRLAAQADLYLADCYAELGEHDERVSVCRHAVQLQPFFVAARERLARALLALGRTDEALGEYRMMLDLPDAPAIGWTKDVGWSAVAKVLILRNLSKPESERHWEDLDPILASLSEAAPESLDALLFRAEVLTSRGQPAEARDLLKQHDEAGAKDVRWWAAMINLSFREGDLDRAQTLLHDAEQAVGDHVELKLLEATLAVHGSADGHVQLAEISRETADWKTPDRARLMYQLAALYVNVGRVGDAQAAYEEIAQLTPQDVRIWQLLFDEALNRNDLPAARKYLDVMRDIEGREGSHSLLAEALLNLRGDSPGGEERRWAAARRILTILQERRPGWSRVPKALGLLDELEGLREAAANHYQQAFELGDRSAELMRRALSLLHALHKYELAEKMINQWEMTPHTPILPEINWMAAEISLQHQDPQQALLRAQRAVSENSPDYRDHLWLAHIQRACGNLPQAESELRTAVRLAPQAGEAWLALTQHLLREKRDDEAQAVIERIRSEAPLDRQPAILAVCLEVLNRQPEAEREYVRALEAAPEDRQLLRDAAEFFQRGRKLVEAERHWRNLVQLCSEEPVPDRCAARRGLAMVLARRGDYAGFREAVTLIEQSLQELPSSAPDLRAKSILLAQRGDPRQRQESAKLFESLAEEEPLTTADQALQANLCELNGDLTAAHQIWQTLAASESNNAYYLARYISVQLKRHEESEAAVWLERLHEAAPDWQTTLELQAEYWLRDGDVQKVVDLFRRRIDHAETDAARARRCVESAAAMERLARDHLRSQPGNRDSLLATAEEYFRKYAELDPTKQHVLAGFLARTGRADDAFALFEKSWETASPAVVSSLMANSLTQADVKPETIAQAVEAISGRLSTPPLASMLNDLAVLEERQQHFVQAEGHYRDALALDPENVIALNNLAFLLALQNRKLDEATELIEKAFNRTGPVAAVLDTRAQVSLAKGDLESARSDREAVAWETLTPAAWFRLAIVYHHLKDQRRLRDAAVKADKGGLKPEELHYFERRFLAPIKKVIEDDV